MTLLTLDRVTKRFQRGRREHTVLDGVSLSVEAGEMVTVMGRRRSGRTTLLRIAGGLLRPDEGVAAFSGRNLADARTHVLGRDVGFVSAHFAGVDSEPVLEHVALGAGASGAPWREAIKRAESKLARVGAADCADLYPPELDPGEAVRVSLARALIARPKLLLVDEPNKGVSLSERDEILGLVRSIADDGVAVVMTVEEATELAGSDRRLRLRDGELVGRAAPAEAQVVPLRRALPDA